MTAVVLDASVTSNWALNDEHHPVAVRALTLLEDAHAHAPAIWWFDCRNALLMAERRGRVTEAQTAAFLQQLAAFDVTLDRDPNEGRMLDLARQHRLTLHDTGYLERAIRLQLPLATLDRALNSAALAEGIALIGA